LLDVVRLEELDFTTCVRELVSQLRSSQETLNSFKEGPILVPFL